MKFRRRIQVLLLLVFACVSAAMLGTADSTRPLSEVRFDLVLKMHAAARVKGILTLKPEQEGSSQIVLPADGLGSLRTELQPGSRWEVSAEIPGYWVRRETLEVGAGPGVHVHQVVLWPKGKISGLLKLDEGERGNTPLPTTLTLSTLAPRKKGSGPDAPKGVLPCPVDSTGRWTCELPAAAYDLSASSDGFVPIYLWAAQVSPDKTFDAGTLTLRRGASLVGWVEVEGALDASTCIARLTLLPASSANPHESGRLDALAREQRVAPNGFLQFTGLAPGTYALEVQQPSYSPARISLIRVVQGGESAIQKPLVLRRALALDLAIDPPLDWLGRPWSLRVSQVSDFTGAIDRTLFDGRADEEGKVVLQEQAAGRYSVSVSDSLGNRLYHALDLEVSGPDDAQKTLTISLLTIKGTVLLGKKPLPAVLWFGGEFGALAVKMESDARGRFHGVLPKGGSWPVEIAASEPSFKTQTTARVEANDQGKATLEIALPDTHVFGKVVQDGGRPAPGARIGVVKPGEEFLVSTREDGTFEVRGLPPGPLQLVASYGSLEEGPSLADALSIHLGEGQSVGPLVLRLRRSKEQTGKVVSAEGPVAGAQVEVAADDAEIQHWDSASTELDGSFTVRVPGSASRLVAVVSAPGKSLQVFEFPAGPAQVPLHLTEAGGTLELSFPEMSQDGSEATLSLFQNGLSLPISTVWRWLRGQGFSSAEARGKELRIPNLAPGQYRACVVVRAATPAPGSGRGTPLKTRCDAGALESGGTLRLSPS